MTRGVNMHRDLFVKFMDSQMFPWKRKNLKTGAEEISAIQGGLRPVELWEYVFPEESLPDVLAMLEIEPETLGGQDTIKNKLKLRTLRKALGAIPIPKVEKPNAKRYIYKENVTIHPIGIKKDIKKDMEKFGYNQEML